MCPSNLLIAPTINIFLYFIEYLFNKNFVLKLSDPSTIISKFFKIFLTLYSLIFFRNVFILIDLFISLTFFF